MTAWVAAQNCAREAARWAEERQGEVVWESSIGRTVWTQEPIERAIEHEQRGYSVRAIRVIATTTKGVG